MFMAVLVFVCLHVLMGFRKRTYSVWLSAYVIRSYYVFLSIFANVKQT